MIFSGFKTTLTDEMQYKIKFKFLKSKCLVILERITKLNNINL